MSAVSAAMYPRSIESGTGQRMTFLGHVSDEEGDWMEVESVVAPGAGPMTHAHPHQVERLTVVRGELSYVIGGGPTQILRDGESATFPAGIAHRFWNSAASPLHLAGRISPPLRFEEFMTLLYGSMSTNRGRPKLRDAARLACEFRNDAELTGMPLVLRKLVLPVVWRVGRLFRGKATRPD